MQIEIVDTDVFERKHTKGDKVLTFRTQSAFVHLDNQTYPLKIKIQLWDKPAYSVGFYSLSDDSFKIDKYQNLVLKSSLSLLPIKSL